MTDLKHYIIELPRSVCKRGKSTYMYEQEDAMTKVRQVDEDRKPNHPMSNDRCGCGAVRGIKRNCLAHFLAQDTYRTAQRCQSILLLPWRRIVIWRLRLGVFAANFTQAFVGSVLARHFSRPRVAIRGRDS